MLRAEVSLERQDGRSAGFTLVELLVSISILSLIMLPLSGLVISYFHNQGTSVARVEESHDAQISAAYFAQDVNAIGHRDYTTINASLTATSSIQQNAAYNAGGFTCGTAATPTAAVRFLSDDFDSAQAQQTTVVAYVIKTVGTERQLHRLRCPRGASSIASDIVMAHNLTAAAPVLTCFSGTAATVPCTGSALPVKVQLQFVVQQGNGAPLTIILVGERRMTTT